MTHIVICLALFAGIFILDLYPQIKKKNTKIVWIYLPIFIVTLTINILYGLGVDLPDPADPIRYFVSSLFGA